MLPAAKRRLLRSAAGALPSHPSSLPGSNTRTTNSSACTASILPTSASVGNNPVIRTATTTTATTPDYWEAVSVVDQKPLNQEEKLQIYKELSKFKLSGFVVMTTMVGYAMAPGVFSASQLALTTIGTAFCVASANTLNQWVEVPFDSQMKRTSKRPIVRGVSVECV
jgi:protoheme IX farnesyltransferase